MEEFKSKLKDKPILLILAVLALLITLAGIASVPYVAMLCWNILFPVVAITTGYQQYFAVLWLWLFVVYTGKLIGKQD